MISEDWAIPHCRKLPVDPGKHIADDDEVTRILSGALQHALSKECVHAAESVYQMLSDMIVSERVKDFKTRKMPLPRSPSTDIRNETSPLSSPVSE